MQLQTSFLAYFVGIFGWFSKEKATIVFAQRSEVGVRVL